MTAVDAVATMEPDERTFRAHLDGLSFQAGVDRGRWRVVGIDWPHATIAVAAAPRPNSPQEFHLRFELTNYPQQAPTATPWDPATGEPLAPDKRPRGEIVSSVFRTDWESGRALYAPYDRIGLSGHSAWPAQHQGDTWTASCDITFYLKRVHRLLNSDDYRGTTS